MYIVQDISALLKFQHLLESARPYLSKTMGVQKLDFHKMGIKKPPHVAGSSVPAILTGLFVAFGGILFGYSIPPASA